MVGGGKLLGREDVLDSYLEECGRLHGHICPGQLLGVRISLLGCGLIGISDPRGVDRKKLIIWVEIDRCITDAISAVTGVRLGKRSLKYLDYGKVAATFQNVSEGKAFRIVARDDSRSRADELFPEIDSRKERQMKAYRLLSDEELFRIGHVRVNLNLSDMPGKPRSRVFCEICMEGINDGRETFDALGRVTCRSCALGGYYEEIPPPIASDNVLGQMS